MEKGANDLPDYGSALNGGTGQRPFTFCDMGDPRAMAPSIRGNVQVRPPDLPCAPVAESAETAQTLSQGCTHACDPASSDARRQTWHGELRMVSPDLANS